MDFSVMKKRFLAIGVASCAGLGMMPLGELPPVDATTAIVLAAGKKGREPCESDAECETKVCQAGTCHPCPDRENCPPPGTCDEERHNTLASEKDKACNQKRACPSADPGNGHDADCSYYTQLRANGKQCVAARKAIMDACFDGGDSDHVGYLEKAQEVVDNCSAYIEGKMDLNVCYECDGFETLRDKAKEACAKPTACAEKKNDAVKVDCSTIRQKIAAADACIARQEELATACFNRAYSKKRAETVRVASGNVAHCRDVLDHKEGKKLCQ
jgi:hypothetical protein